MSIQAERLRQYNRWRRGDDSIPAPDPKVLGELLDAVADRLESLEQEIENLEKQKGRNNTELSLLREARQYVMLHSPSGAPFDFPRELIAMIDAALASNAGIHRAAEGRQVE